MHVVEIVMRSSVTTYTRDPSLRKVKTQTPAGQSDGRSRGRRSTNRISAASEDRQGGSGGGRLDDPRSRHYGREEEKRERALTLLSFSWSGAAPRRGLGGGGARAAHTRLSERGRA